MFLASTDNIADQAWYIDSGASNHVTNDTSNMQHKREYHGKETMTDRNGEKLNICHIGLVKLLVNSEKYLLLKDTLHVPKIEKNLVSV